VIYRQYEHCRKIYNLFVRALDLETGGKANPWRVQMSQLPNCLKRAEISVSRDHRFYGGLCEVSAYTVTKAV
jgi:hypothetical protein